MESFKVFPEVDSGPMEDNANYELFQYFLMRVSDVEKIYSYFSSICREDGLLPVENFLRIVKVNDNGLVAEILNIITYQSNLINRDMFTRIYLYFVLLDTYDLFHQVILLLISRNHDRNKLGIFHIYLSFINERFMSENQKSSLMNEYIQNKYDVNQLLSKYYFLQMPAPFLLPIIELQDQLSNIILPEYRITQLQQLRLNYDEIHNHIIRYNKLPKLSICQYIRYCFNHSHPYQYNFHLSPQIFHKFKLPILLIRSPTKYNPKTQSLISLVTSRSDINSTKVSDIETPIASDRVNRVDKKDR